VFEMRRAVESRRGPWRAFAGALVASLVLVMVAGVIELPDFDVLARGGEADLPSTPAPDPATLPPVARFVAFVEARAADRGSDRDAARDHDYAADGLRHLADALDAIGARADADSAATRARIRGITLRLLADSLEFHPTAPGHAHAVRNAFLGTADALGAIQRREFPALAHAAEELRVAAWAITAGRPLREQGTAIDRFFDRASELLRAMAAA
jgi:hypothetical protein